ncbi:TPA: hypothetical protein N0X73_000655, partial [Escherichia coli]|nr:hypothetical protein [Escherichia coli]HCK7445790.1 hypothetical protein [Escherichia coli]
MKFHSEIKNSIKNAKKFKGILFVNIISYLLLTIAIRKGHSKEILKFKWLILLFGGSVAKYFVARASFLNGDYIFAKKLYQEIIKVNPIHTDSYYGLADVYRLTGNKLEAKDVLIQVFNFSDRLKTWLLLANLVDTKKDYDELLNHWERECSYRNILKYHYDVNDYLIIAALRAKLYEEALNRVKVLLGSINSEAFILPKTSNKNFSVNAAKIALLGLKKILDANKIQFFLVSGTLLGCIRDKKLLKHDKDIDIGVWSETNLSVLSTKIACSGLFDIAPMRSPYTLRIKHVNGVAIDIFFHYRDHDSYWHAGSKLRWNNTPFNLISYGFLGNVFLIPENYDLYLTENYGNWMQEKMKFDSAFDTPNHEIVNMYELKIHAYKKLIINMKIGSVEGVRYYEDKLNE